MAELEKELALALEEQQVESSSAGTPTSQVLAWSRHHRTRSRVENTLKLPVADEKRCEMFLDMAQLRTLRGGSSGE